jgi:hypothetical protein
MATEDRYYAPRGGLLSTLLALILIVAAVFLSIAIWPYVRAPVAGIPTIIVATAAPVPTQPPRTDTNTDTSTAPIAPVPTLSAVQLQDPAQNGGNVAPAGCQFPAQNGVCANGGGLNEDVAPAEMAKPEQAAPVPIPVIATIVPGAIRNPSLGQCQEGTTFTDQGCKRLGGDHEKAKP